MLTLFTTAKSFVGHSGIIQCNALQSWTRLHHDVEVILFGDEEGAADAANNLGLRHEARVERHPSGLKYINYMFSRAQQIARHEIVCYVNCDIILTPDFCNAVQIVGGAHASFLMIGRRWDTAIVKPIDFAAPRWSDEIRQLARETKDQRDGWWIDYFCFTRNLYKQIPAFVIGRVHWDNWLVWKALHSGVAVIDASNSVVAVHQNHGYSYHPQGQAGVWTDPLSRRNLALAGGIWHQSTILDATEKLNPNGLLKPNWARSWHAAERTSLLLYGRVKRALTYDLWLPIWHFCLGMSRPIRMRLGLRSELFRRQKDSSGDERR